ncbi:hypothetical protein GCM10017044_02730 [Kordiimonas sediminis]|uniref:RidA family protein n=1 Tax=Kordiimonas sediminis TaxID=1735581 RepID=A0A919E4I6_9PROT|nr:Rid family detoxifying hydrolase [Kordiimonas sediminis]GHF12256.1 hypothetical protein GCM10017044_02730 [Kordiimonas sediminis]
MSLTNKLTAALFATALTAGAVNADVKFHQKPGDTSGYPFSESVEVNGLLFMSGQIGTGPDGQLVEGGIVAESNQTMKNIQEALARRGLDTSDLVKCTVFLQDIKEWASFNTVYRQYFKGSFPARSALAASGLALNSRVEVECIAALR